MDEFLQGDFEVQDEASQLVSLRVDCKVSIIFGLALYLYYLFHFAFKS